MKLKVRDRQILRIVLPAIVTNITVPLLGLVDTAIVGHMGSASYIAAIAVGSMIFNLLYWVFAFLRMGTSGMTAQARGRRDFAEARQLLVNAALLAIVIALLLLLLQIPLRELMLWLISPTPDVRPLAVTYFHIVVWGAPAMLLLYALSGWYIGMQNTRIPMFISIMQNVVNIILSLLLVYGFGMKVAGVALGTVVAQYAGFFVATILLWKYYRKILRRGRTKNIQKSTPPLGYILRNLPSPATLRTAFSTTYRDIFLRTLCLVAVNLFFTSAGARQGATILAVNTLLLQLYLLFSYIMDGFAYAGEALGGRFWGARDSAAFHDLVRRLFGWGIIMTLLFTAVYVFGGMPFLRLLTDEAAVVEASRAYVWWAYLIPAAGITAFIWDGIFIGITQTRGMLLSAILSSLLFFAVATSLMGIIGNHGLWLAQVLYLAMRGLVQTLVYRTIK